MSGNLLRRAFDAADRIARRMESSRSRHGALFPVTADILFEMADEEREPLEAFLKRFEQLQDMVGERLVRTLLQALGESPDTARDRANLAERYGLLPDFDAWLEARVLRNKLAHDYPLDEDMQAKRLNDAWRLAGVPLAVLARCHDLAARDTNLSAAMAKES